MAGGFVNVIARIISSSNEVTATFYVKISCISLDIAFRFEEIKFLPRVHLSSKIDGDRN